MYRFLTQIMTPPFLPPELIEPVFHQLDQRVRSDRVETFIVYVWRQWFQRSTFGVRNWSVFLTSVRTNDLEGLQHRINSMIDSGGPVPSTSSSNSSTKTTAIPMQARLLTEGQLKRIHRKQTPRLNGK